jgi:F-type H+-transporting ATPase subunit epsilon
MQKEWLSMQTFKLTIMSPKETLFDSEVFSAIFHGVDGFFEILAQHAPFIAVIHEGIIEMTALSGEKTFIEIPGGYFEFTQNRGNLLSFP